MRTWYSQFRRQRRTPPRQGCSFRKFKFSCFKYVALAYLKQEILGYEIVRGRGEKDLVAISTSYHIIEKRSTLSNQILLRFAPSI